MNWQLTFTIIVSIVGWCVVHWLSAQRDRKKEWREFARATALLIDGIEKTAVSYHVAKDRNIAMEWELKNSIEKLDTQVQLVKKHLTLQCDTSFFRSAITLENFQTSDFKQQYQHSKLIQNISWHAIQLKNGLFTAE